MKNRHIYVSRRELLGILALGFQPTGTTAEELNEIQRADYDKWGTIVKASGFQPE